MPRRRRSSTDPSIAQGIMLILLVGYGTLIKFWGSLSPEEKWLFGTFGAILLVTAVTFVVVLILYRKRKRREAWQKAMQTWNQNVKTKTTPQFNTAEDLSPQALEKLAMQVYKQMGYRSSLTGGTGDHGIDVRLVDPNGKVELVQCKQWNRPVGEPEVRDLMGAIIHEKAAKGYIWAPRGFSWSAKKWTKGKPILLMDNDDIGRLVESVYLG